MNLQQGNYSVTMFVLVAFICLLAWKLYVAETRQPDMPCPIPTPNTRCDYGDELDKMTSSLIGAIESEKRRIGSGQIVVDPMKQPVGPEYSVERKLEYMQTRVELLIQLQSLRPRLRGETGSTIGAVGQIP